MARVSALDEYTLDLRRAAVMLAVVAAHVALVIVMLRSAGRSTDVVDITLFALPITPEDRPREPVHVQKPPISRASETAPRRAAVARESATEQHVEPSLGESSRSENNTLGDTAAAHAGAANEPAPPIDWHGRLALTYCGGRQVRAWYRTLPVRPAKRLRRRCRRPTCLLPRLL